MSDIHPNPNPTLYTLLSAVSFSRFVSLCTASLYPPLLPIPCLLMGENPNCEGWVNPRLPLTATSFAPSLECNPTSEGWVNPRRPLTAMNPVSGGVAGDVGLPSFRAIIAARRRTHPCRPPVATCATDSPIPNSPTADPPSDLSSVGDGLAGGSEESSSFSWISLPEHMKKANPKMWAEAVAEAEAFVDEMKKNGLF